jgi:hypothetical protein
MFQQDIIPRGSIKFPERYKQLISYEGMERMRKITPTDIDGLIDYNGNAFIFIEGKHIEAEFPMGQRRAFENIINALTGNNKVACCLLFRHESNADELIIAKDCIVTERFYKGRWKTIEPIKLLDAIKQTEIFWIGNGIEL